MLVRDTERTAAADLELQSLETELAATKYLGNSQRERMLLKLLDISLEPLPRMPGANISVEQVSARSLNRLNDILHAVSDFNPEVMDHQGRS